MITSTETCTHSRTTTIIVALRENANPNLRGTAFSGGFSCPRPASDSVAESSHVCRAVRSIPPEKGEEDGFGKEGEGTVASFPREGSREGLQPFRWGGCLKEGACPFLHGRALRGGLPPFISPAGRSIRSTGLLTTKQRREAAFAASRRRFSRYPVPRADCSPGPRCLPSRVPGPGSPLQSRVRRCACGLAR